MTNLTLSLPSSPPRATVYYQTCWLLLILYNISINTMDLLKRRKRLTFFRSLKPAATSEMRARSISSVCNERTSGSRHQSLIYIHIIFSSIFKLSTSLKNKVWWNNRSRTSNHRRPRVASVARTRAREGNFQFFWLRFYGWLCLALV